jgi:excisionase family DNA binding protein
MTDTEATHTISPTELGDAIGRSPDTVRRWIRRGYIRAIQLGSSYRISKADANAWWRDQGGGLLYPDHGIGELPEDEDGPDEAIVNED